MEQPQQIGSFVASLGKLFHHGQIQSENGKDQKDTASVRVRIIYSSIQFLKKDGCVFNRGWLQSQLDHSSAHEHTEICTVIVGKGNHNTNNQQQLIPKEDTRCHSSEISPAT